MNKKIIFLIMSIIIFLLSGCTAISSPYDLMKKPSKNIKGINIEKVVSEFLPENRTLTLANEEPLKGAIRFVNLDKDPTNELLVLYKDIGSSAIYGIIILKINERRWYKINDIPLGKWSIDLLDFVDITGDGKPEIILGSKDTFENTKNLSIYSSDNGYFKQILTKNYINFSIEDINNDGELEVILFNKITSYKITADILKYNGSEIYKLESYTVPTETLENESKITLEESKNFMKK